ncbi:hypothetical protein GCM10010435_51280 [Winogradskya consettensis]|uniref:Uncharacterized protein n=1 Tax=Winogradskya consettensis TaxID=113560 RepID=A0A919SI22_9ACTN|nr:hypothetical protein [Actinoplanes consettensis]GIM72004.1 hypothetical protein Aco04nite_28150 [Actinoplanes consettensis]
MTDAEIFCKAERDQWRDRLESRVQEAARKKAAAAAAERARKARRNHGLIARHAARMARIKRDDYPFPPDPECSE